MVCLLRAVMQSSMALMDARDSPLTFPGSLGPLKHVLTHLAAFLVVTLYDFLSCIVTVKCPRLKLCYTIPVSVCLRPPANCQH